MGLGGFDFSPEANSPLRTLQRPGLARFAIQLQNLIARDDDLVLGRMRRRR